VRALDVFGIAAGALRRHRRRTVLCLLGTAVGVAAVIVLVGLGEAGRDFVRSQFEVLGTDIVAVLPGKVETSGGLPGFGGVPNDLTIADARALQRGVTQADLVAPVFLGNENVGYRDLARRSIVFGSTAEILPIRDLEVRVGSFLPDEPWERGSSVAVLGPELAERLFGIESPLGKLVKVGAWRLRVIGVLGTQGSHFGIDMDQAIFVPVATAMRMFDRSSLFRIVLQARPGFSTDTVEQRTAAILHARHGEEDFTITTPDAIMSALAKVLGVLTLALSGIAAISLGVAGIGTMNVMLVSVSERTPEVGLFEALGATRRQILALFLAEAALLSSAGGLVGLAGGSLALRSVELFLPSFPAHAPLWAALAALGLSLVVGTVFGFWPAWRATRLDPVAALAGRIR